MRHIIQSELISKIRDEWIKEAEEALEELVKKTPEERKKFIRTNTLWTKYKDALCEVSDDKCWYSERKFSRSELEVEHFRPKGKVATVKHPGYWWLAYNWRNFRLSSSLANKRREDFRNRNKQIMGKGTYFPLEDPTKRASDQDPAKLAEERPLLIDPIILSDVCLLDYATASGKVLPRHKKEGSPNKNLRAEISIGLYHLNDGHLIKERFNIYASIEDKSKKIEKRLQKQEENTITPEEENELNDLINDISKLINTSASYSSFARKCLMENGDRGWNTELLMAC